MEDAHYAIEMQLFGRIRPYLFSITTAAWLIIGGYLGVPTCQAQTLLDLTSKVTMTKSGLLLNRHTNTFNTLVTVTNNVSSPILNAPLLLLVTNLTPSTVALANQSGQDPSGNPFISLTVPANGLAPGNSISNILLQFSNPDHVSFTFGLSLSTVQLLPDPLPLNAKGPAIESIPPSVALVGQPLQYQVIASSSDSASLLFSLTGAPTGMTINQQSGLVLWTPSPGQLGDQAINIIAQDSAGQTSQSFTLSVFGSTALTSIVISAASGGVITINNSTSHINGLTIAIPPGALASDTTLTISELIPPPTLGGVPRFLLKGFSVQPEGITLAIPAAITMPYSPTEFTANAGVLLESFLGAYFLQASTGHAQWIDSFSTDSTSHTIKGTIAHFSAFFFANGAELCAPTANIADCPETPTLTAPFWSVPTVLVHGFLGGRNTFGQLTPLLGSNAVHAWRFDWDTLFTPFEASGVLLEGALQAVEKQENASLVNLVAHSFGGILVRTYLQDFYRADVNRTITVGTPHQGIGGDYSLLFATGCAKLGVLTGLPVTCFEAATGEQGLIASLSRAGFFLRTLNESSIPPLLSPLTPNYDIITGQVVACVSPEPCSLVPNDGLITTAGNQLCGPSPEVCGDRTVVEEINPNVPDGTGLCHTGVLMGITCDPSRNIPMVDFQDANHPLWSKFCDFLRCFRLLGNWSGSATVVDSEGTEVIPVSASFVQTSTSMNVSIVYTEPGDIPVTNTLIYTMSSGTISFTNSDDQDSEITTANATYTFDSKQGLIITGTGQNNDQSPSSGSGTLTLSPDGLTMTATNVTIVESEGQSTGSGNLTISPDGSSITGSATTADGVTFSWTAQKQ